MNTARQLSGVGRRKRAKIWERFVTSSTPASAVCARLGRHHFPRTFRKTLCSSKQAYLPQDRLFLGKSRTTNLGPFGELIRASGPMAKANPIRWSDKSEDSETGLVYYGYRLYNPNTGRWLDRDPLEETGGINLYNFCGNTPTEKSDAIGLSGPVYGCPACICKLVKYGDVSKAVTTYVNNPGPGQALIGITVPYYIETVGIASMCHCKYVDNGSVSGTGRFADNEQYSPCGIWNNTTYPISCTPGKDKPGFILGFPAARGFSLTYTLNFNWTGTVTCESDFGPTLSDSVSLKATISGKSTWRPTSQ